MKSLPSDHDDFSRPLPLFPFHSRLMHFFLLLFSLLSTISFLLQRSISACIRLISPTVNIPDKQPEITNMISLSFKKELLPTRLYRISSVEKFANDSEIQRSNGTF